MKLTRKKKKLISSLGYLILIPSVIFNLFYFSKNQNPQDKIEKYLVNKVLDGDTFIIRKSQLIRLFDVDAPPLEYCGGEESKKRLEELVLNKEIQLREIRADKYGRIMALAYVGKILVNEAMITDGWVEYHSPQTSQSEKLKQLNHKAKEKRIGIYDPKCYQTENLENPDCLIKGNIHARTKEKNYFFPGCSNYKKTIIEKFRGDQWFCSEKEAQKAGFKKSDGCFDKKYQL